MKIKHNPKLKDLPHMDYREIAELQGNLKDLNEANYNRLLSSLKETGMLWPYSVWFNPQEKDKAYILDGHQRKRVMVKEDIEPYKVPYLDIPGANLEEAKKNLLQLSSQYGTATQEGWDEFTNDIDDQFLKDTIYFDNLWREFADVTDLDSELLAGESDDKGGGTSGGRSSSDDAYRMFELVMLHTNKNILIDKINQVKETQGFDKIEDALMYIVNKFKS